MVQYSYVTGLLRMGPYLQLQPVSPTSNPVDRRWQRTVPALTNCENFRQVRYGPQWHSGYPGDGLSVTLRPLLLVSRAG